MTEPQLPGDDHRAKTYKPKTMPTGGSDEEDEDLDDRPRKLGRSASYGLEIMSIDDDTSYLVGGSDLALLAQVILSNLALLLLSRSRLSPVNNAGPQDISDEESLISDSDQVAESKYVDIRDQTSDTETAAAAQPRGKVR